VSSAPETTVSGSVTSAVVSSGGEQYDATHQQRTAKGAVRGVKALMETTYRNPKLDNLRGIAAAIVVIHHAINIGDLSLVDRVLTPPLSAITGIQDHLNRLAISAFSGGSAVTIFFILSGAVLSASLSREPKLDTAAAARFAVRRVLRIYPAMIAAILLFWAFSHLSLPALGTKPFTLIQVALNCLLIDRGVMVATWTLQVEMLMVPVILFVILLQRFYGALAIIGFLIFGIVCIFQGSPIFPDILNVALMAFALGMLVPTEITKIAATKLPTTIWMVFFLLMIVFRFLAPFTATADLVLDVVLAFAIVAILYYSADHDNILDLPAIRFLGRISFSLYLTHVIITRELFPFFRDAIGASRYGENNLMFGLAYGFVVLAISIPISALSEAYIERPFIRMGRKFRIGSTVAL
jgi:peptidoglycan/LPS O-acetylase OafA/YrhL